MLQLREQCTVQQALTTLKRDDNITTAQADKGRVTALLNSNDYVEKCEVHLSNCNVYSKNCP